MGFHMSHKHPVNRELLDQRSRIDVAVDRFVVFFGSLKFIAWMTVMIICWIAFNTLALTGTLHFDRYPFILLNLLFSTQASYAAPLILLSQNRAAEHDRLTAEHDYETNAAALAAIQAIQRHLGIE
jgi:uncharacterized membrane protein